TLGDDILAASDFSVETQKTSEGDWINVNVRRIKAKPFDLCKPGQSRLHVLITNSGEMLLVSILHQLIADEWSWKIWFERLFALYHYEKLLQPEATYLDFCVWMASVDANQVLDRQKQYWLKKLSGKPPLLALPIAKPRPAQRSFRGGKVSVSIDFGLV